MNKDEWSKQICEMHVLDAKLRIANILHENFNSQGNDLDKLPFPEFANRQTLRANIAMQLLSTAFELTEDLAATSFSYAKAIRLGTKNVPEYLRDFGDLTLKKPPEEIGTPALFYKNVSKKICYAAEMLGLDPVKNVGDAAFLQKFFKNVKDFRDKHDDWYQGYKHGQRTLSVYGYPINVEPTINNVSFWLYRIPETLQEKDGNVFVEEDLVDIIKEEPMLFKLINDIFSVWQGVKQRQFAKVFPIPTAPQANQTSVPT
jgi:hypothetical protein